ncbi:MAG: helix-turn-helix transcriptional regulator [Bacteroidia bacterium]|nr:helix-turn-helix transcriptional regulator [Bacteroidia bacterium]
MSIGSRIKVIAKSKKVSPQQLGNIIGKTRQAVYDIYNDRVSISIDTVVKIAKELNVPLITLLIENPDAYYDLMPKAIPIEEILKLLTYIHENTKEGLGLVNLRITKSSEGMFILESVFNELKNEITEEEINKFGNYVYESYLVTSPELLKK